jgi:CHAD domain-containing protein
VSRHRDRARKRLAAELPIADLRRLVKKLERVLPELEREETSGAGSSAWRWALDARVARRASRLATAIRDAGALYIPERLHAVRVALKKTRYAMELVNEISGAARDPDTRALKRGQDLLGRMHDLQVLTDRVRDVQTSLAPPTLSVWRELDALILALEDDCRRLHARYMRLREPLAAIADRVGARTTTTPARAVARRAG